MLLTAWITGCLEEWIVGENRSPTIPCAIKRDPRCFPKVWFTEESSGNAEPRLGIPPPACLGNRDGLPYLPYRRRPACSRKMHKNPMAGNVASCRCAFRGSDVPVACPLPAKESDEGVASTIFIREMLDSIPRERRAPARHKKKTPPQSKSNGLFTASMSLFITWCRISRPDPF